MNVLLDEHFEKLVKQMLESGEFSSDTEVVQAGLQLLEKPLGLCGCIVEQTYYREYFIDAMGRFKSGFFGDDPDYPVILHREDIIGRIGVFSSLSDKDLRRRYKDRVSLRRPPAFPFDPDAHAGVAPSRARLAYVHLLLADAMRNRKSWTSRADWRATTRCTCRASKEISIPKDRPSCYRRAPI